MIDVVNSALGESTHTQILDDEFVVLLAAALTG
jgi:hypothetical protein